MASVEQHNLSDYRSITPLYIRFLTTAIFAATTYLGVNITKAIKQSEYLLLHDDDAPLPVIYYILGSLDTHAQVTSLRDGIDGLGSENPALPRIVPALEINPSALTVKRTKSGFAFFARLATVLFALVQAIDATILYIRRIRHSGRDTTSNIDHQISWLAISNIVCSLADLIALIIRTEYSIEEELLLGEENQNTLSSSRGTLQGLILEIGVALFSQGILEDAIVEDIKENSRTSILVYKNLQPQTIALGIILLLFRFFRKEIRHLTYLSERKDWISQWRLRKLKALLLFWALIWILIDVVWVLVLDIMQSVKWWDNLKQCIEYPERYDSWDVCQAIDFQWWKDPMDDAIVVI